jgi:NADH-quinone oxidoreductase subunit A
MTFFLSPYFPIFLAFTLIAFIMVAMSTVAYLLGPKKPNPAKLDVYECGIPVQETASARLSVKYYLTAILFILFDLETIFLFLWAINFDKLGWFGVIEIGLFLATLVAGYIYIIKRGALRWE